MASVAELSVSVEITEGERLFTLLAELAELTTTQEMVSRRISEVSKEIRSLADVKAD